MAEWDLVLGDCLEGMARLADRSVDHVISDPPYSEWTHAKVRRGGSVHVPDATEGVKRPVISTSKVLGFAALSDETRNAAAVQFARLCRRWVLVFTDDQGIAEWRYSLEAAGLENVRVGAWVKPGACPQFTGDRPATGWEAIVIAHRPGKKRWNGGGKHGVWTFPIVSGGSDRLHTTQKPEALMEALVRDFTDPGDLILDPFAGSGTTGVAALRNGRRFIGWERDPKYHAIATKRLGYTKEQRCLAL